MRLLLDEMYSPGLGAALRDVGLDATTILEERLSGAADGAVFAAAQATGRALLTENVGDFTRLAAEHSANGDHHKGLLIALSSRFSRRPAGTAALVAAIRAVAHERLDDRIVYLERPET